MGKEVQESSCFLKAGDADVESGDVSDEGEPSAVDECDFDQEGRSEVWCVCAFPKLGYDESDKFWGDP